VTLELEAVGDHTALGLGDEDLVEMYRRMVIARKLDDRMWALNRQGRVPFVVSVSGHEATQIGAAYALDPRKDWSLPYYRDVAFNIGIGVSPDDIFLGVFAKAGDPASGGRQMPNHWSEPDLNIFTHSSPIATQFPHAVGIAYELKRQGSDAVVLVSGGEGSTSEGDWHEAMNFAGIHRLPVIFLIQNNLYAISVPESEQVAGQIADRAAGYGIEGVVVDGNDLLTVYGAMTAAVAKARAGEGPTLIEAKTYRYYAHTSDDDDKLYRTREEVEQWRRKDPIPAFRRYLKESAAKDLPYREFATQLQTLEALQPEFAFCDHRLLPVGDSLPRGSWAWAVYEVTDAGIARALHSRGVTLVESMAPARLRTELAARAEQSA